MPYEPPTGWVEQIEALERLNWFHEDPACPQITRRAELVRVQRPGRSRQCRRCVRNSATALLASGEVA